MISENQIKEILNDLFSLQPDLQNREAEIRQIISQLVELKPEAALDPNFKEQLRSRLLSQEAARGFAPKPNIFKSLISNLNFMKEISSKALAGALVVVVLLLAGSFYAGKKQAGTANPSNGQNLSNTNGGGNPIALAPIGSDSQVKAISQIKKFASDQEFKAYLTAGASATYGYGNGSSRSMSALPKSTNEIAPMPNDSLYNPLPENQTAADRSSQTNVQVKGIDEPDIVKTDGNNLYVSTQQLYYGFGDFGLPIDTPVKPDAGTDAGIAMPYRQPEQSTKIISALPPKALKKLGKIDRQGEMLLSGDTLIIFNYDAVYGFDIKDKANPKESWKIKYENNSYLNTSRLMDGKLYLVTSSYPNYDSPCPIVPLSTNNTKISMPCDHIYHPVVTITDMTVYSAFKINPQNGQVENQLSFVGSSGQAIVYMSKNALYLSYSYLEDQVKILNDFLKTDGKGLFPDSVAQKLDKLNSYDISSSAKMVELEQIMQRHLNSLDPDGRVKFENDVQNKMASYIKVHKRDLQFTGIAKIALDKFEVSATGDVPGTPLNQFSLDEYQGNLRIATNIMGNGLWFYWGGGSSNESANDVYVLDSSLKQIGKVLDLGKGERIYSARFIEDKGYLVTFKQTDPFYVLDLSNAKNPRAVGELKIPGFSSYLHPLAKNRILGVGQEDGRVKLSLFDVSDPANPKEIDKYQLNEYWTEVSNNHHAFLQDEKHQVFFLPGGNGGYIFSYSGDKFELKKAVTQVQSQRAVYINDFMYIVGSDKIVVVDEKNWERVGELGL